MMGCDCDHDPAVSVWTGWWPGVLECQAKGWYSKLTDHGWVETTADDPEGTEDLNRWAIHRIRSVSGPIRRK